MKKEKCGLIYIFNGPQLSNDIENDENNIRFWAFANSQSSLGRNDPREAPAWDFNKGSYLIPPEEYPYGHNYETRIYLDENESRPFIINNKEAVRHYYYDYYDSRGIGERIFIKDPLIKNRIIVISYREEKDKSFSLENIEKKSMPTAIKNAFNKERYKIFEEILKSLEVLPTDTTAYTEGYFKTLGISFQYPKYWGDAVEEMHCPPNADCEKDSDFYLGIRIKGLLFGSLSYVLGAYGKAEPAISFNINVSSHTERPDPINQYGGQPLNKACENNAYLGGENTGYTINLTRCDLRQLPKGLQLVTFKGAAHYKYGEENDLDYIKGAILPTKSKDNPGLTILLKTRNKDEFTSLELILDKIINSLSYK